MPDGDHAWFAKLLDGQDDPATRMPDDAWNRVSTEFIARVDRVDDTLVPEDEGTPIDPWSSDHASDSSDPDDPYADDVDDSHADEPEQYQGRHRRDD